MGSGVFTGRRWERNWTVIALMLKCARGVGGRLAYRVHDGHVGDEIVAFGFGGFAGFDGAHEGIELIAPGA